MIEFILGVLGFTIKAAVVFGAFALFWLLISAAGRALDKVAHEPKVKYLNDSLLSGAKAIYSELYPKQKFPVRTDDAQSTPRPRTFVLDFDGDAAGNGGSALEKEITSIIAIASPLHGDNVVMRLNSPGGTVTGYGLAAAQLERLRTAQIPLTVCVDQVAASGGYLMACVANRIVASPFATIGSIGVVMEMPNFSTLLDKIGVSMFTSTAGESKRTVTPWSHPTAEAKQKLADKLLDVHQHFKSLIGKYRSSVDLDKVATGETWLATQALDLNLVDEIATSEAYLVSQLASHNIYSVRVPGARSKSGGIAGRLFARLSNQQMKFG